MQRLKLERFDANPLVQSSNYEIKTFNPCRRTINIDKLGSINLPFPYITFLYKRKNSFHINRNTKYYMYYEKSGYSEYLCNTIVFSNENPLTVGDDVDVYLPPLPNIYHGTDRAVSEPCLAYCPIKNKLTIDGCIDYFWNSYFVSPTKWYHPFYLNLPEDFADWKWPNFGPPLDNEIKLLNLYKKYYNNLSNCSLKNITSVNWKNICGKTKLSDLKNEYESF